MKRTFPLLSLLAAGSLVAACATAPTAPPGPAPDAAPEAAPEPPPPPPGGSMEARDTIRIRPYSEVVTDEARSRSGLFTTHLVGDKLFFEIPPAEIGTDLLLVSRGDAGGRIGGSRVIRWERQGNRMVLRQVSYDAVADPGSAIHRAVEALTHGRIIATLPIRAEGRDGAPVVDVTDLFTTNVTEFTSMRGLQRDRSFLERVVAFPRNVEVMATQTGSAPPVGAPPGTPPQTTTMRINWSILKLPDDPMMPRLHDSRVGLGSVRTVDYSRPEHRAEERRYIRRFRLEKQDPTAPLSDPVEPIVFWIDAATPEWLVPWTRAGIEEWQPAFEEAGFTNAIIAREAPDPAVDPDWSMHDARHSMVYWRPSTVQNATGGNTVDPRTGEIIKAEVNMFHNVMNLLRNWYFTQVSPLDVRAQSLPLPDDLMGRLVQYVVAHEVGHAIGYPHNFKASAMYPADSIRSRSFLERKGSHVATLMDYSRFNYVAQPEDSIPPELLIPKVGPYDHFAVMWAHRPIPDARTPDEERPTLDRWARMQDTVPWFRFTTTGATQDPEAVTEAVGNQDPVRSTTYGLRNLERVVSSLLRVAERPGEDYSLLQELYGNAVSQWNRYNSHVAALIGGAQSQERLGTGPRFEPIPRDRQREAMDFLAANSFTVPHYFLDRELLRRMEQEGVVNRFRTAHGQLLRSLLSAPRLNRLVEYEALESRTGRAYTVSDLFSDLRRGAWTELPRGSVSIDVYRRNLQRAYLDAAAGLVNGDGPEVRYSDARPLMRGELRDLDRAVAGAIPRAANRATRLHLEDVRAEIARILDPPA